MNAYVKQTATINMIQALKTTPLITCLSLLSLPINKSVSQIECRQAEPKAPEQDVASIAPSRLEQIRVLVTTVL
ncbi:hypothetical protein OH492_23665 [Vibrio chagasii]|nr:hypothetical protein [Vibrio chagasii]